MAERKAGDRTEKRDPGFRENPRWGIGSTQGGEGPAAGSGSRGSRRAASEAGQADLLAIKSHIHRRLLERLNLSNLDRLDRDEVMETIRALVRELLAAEAIPVNLEERDELIRQVLDEIFGLGPLQPLIDDPTIADVLVNTCPPWGVGSTTRLQWWTRGCRTAPG
jgi:pilus assembly protein CpaF